MVLLCEPALPPVSVSMGIKVTSIGTAAKALSYRARIPPVIIPEIISAISQKIRLLANAAALLLRYPVLISCSVQAQICSALSGSILQATAKRSCSSCRASQREACCGSISVRRWPIVR